METTATFFETPTRRKTNKIKGPKIEVGSRLEPKENQEEEATYFIMKFILLFAFSAGIVLLGDYIFSDFSFGYNLIK